MAISALEKHFSTLLHMQQKAGTSDEQGQWAKGILRDLQSENFWLHAGYNKGTVNIQKDLSEWQTMYDGHGYHPWDHSDTLRLTQTRQRTPVQEVQRGPLWRDRYSSGGTTELLQCLWSWSNAPRAFSCGNHDIKSLVEHFSKNYRTEEEETSIISMWPALRTRLVRQKAISPNDVFSNPLASRPDDVKDCLILLDLMPTSTPSTAKCEPGFFAINHLKCEGQNTLSDLMQMRSSDHAMKAYRRHSAISNWFSGARDTFWRYSN